MPRVSNIDRYHRREQPTVAIRTTTAVENLPALIGEGYGRMGEYLKEVGKLLADIPYVAYHNADLQHLDVEIGFPVSAALPGHEDIRPGSIPEGDVFACMYRGPYREIVSTHTEMVDRIEIDGFKPVGPVYEHYYNGPGCPESELLTMIVMPVV